MTKRRKHEYPRHKEHENIGAPAASPTAENIGEKEARQKKNLVA